LRRQECDGSELENVTVNSWRRRGGYRSLWGGMGSGLTPRSISPRQRLDDVVKLIGDLPFGGTDCALPMVEARKHG
jgi:hypothetical protein